MSNKHSHYYKNVEHLKEIDVYRVLQLFNVIDPCMQHAIKKLLVAGGRGAGKDVDKDVQEAIDSLIRWQEMRQEENIASPTYKPHITAFRICDKCYNGDYKPVNECSHCEYKGRLVI